MKELFYIVILAYQISTPNTVETFVEMENPYNTLSECRESLTKQTIVTGTYDEAVFFITKKQYRYDWHAMACGRLDGSGDSFAVYPNPVVPDLPDYDVYEAPPVIILPPDDQPWYKKF